MHKFGIEKFMLKSSYPLNKIREICIQIADYFDKKNRLELSNEIQQLSDTVDESIYDDIYKNSNIPYTGDPEKYFIVFTLMEKIGVSDINTIDDVVSSI